MGDTTPGAEAARPCTFLFTDVEGSTRLLQRLGDAGPSTIARHNALLTAAIGQHGGTVRLYEGDGLFATFDTAYDAIAAAVDGQHAIVVEPWPPDCEVRVRMGLHTGKAVTVAGELVGLDINRASRIMGVGWGGQILASDATAQAVQGVLPDTIALRTLGRHRLKDLAEPERIHQVVAANLRDDFPPLRSLDAIPNNLPTQLTSFVGRRREVGEVARLLGGARLLTLTGPGGTGKTRLSLQVAAEVADEHPDGVYFVALASVQDPELVMSAVAGALGIAHGGAETPLHAVIEHLRHRRVLLVLDNFEQVLDAAGDVAELLRRAPGVTALVTSRAPLRLVGEQEFPVPTLRVPALPKQDADHPGMATDVATRDGLDLDDVATSEAAALFLARTTAVRPDFRLTPDNVEAVAEITRRLDGLPLAIELAASRVRMLTVEAIATRLKDSLALLSSGARDLPDRQRTLREAIAWSDRLLAETTHTLFARMSVFRGGAELDQIEAVCAPGLPGSVFEGLAELVDNSLVRRADTGESIRFSMLETIREFGAECLETSGEGDELRRRHAAVYLAMVEEASPHLTGPSSAAHLDRIGTDHDNVRAAMRRSIEQGETTTALRLLASMWRFWQIRGHLHEARRNVDRVFALPDVDAHPVEHADALEAAGGLCYWMADLAASRVLYERALEIHRSREDAASVVRGLYNVAFAYGLEDPPHAQAAFREALVASEQLGDELAIAKAHWGMSVGALWGGDWDAIMAESDLAIPVFRARHATFDLAWALHMKGLGEHASGHVEVARALFDECLDMFLEAGDATGVYLVLADFAFLAEARGDHERALRLFGAAERISEETGTSLLEPQLELLPRPQRAEDQFDAARVEALREEGRAMTREQAIAYARQG